MKRTDITILIFLLLTFLCGFACGRHYAVRMIVCDTVTITDCIPYMKPVVRDSLIVRYKTIRLPADTVFKETVVRDSVEIMLPITQKVYADSTYRAYISGYNPCLDSLFLFPKHETVTIRAKPKRWSLGIQAGYGITLQNSSQFVPHIGVGVSYSLWQF